MTALDAIGPYEVLSRLPGADVRFAAAETGPKRCDSGSLSLVADWTLDEVGEPDVVVVPGGPGTREETGQELVQWIRRVHRSARWTTSVCTGSLLLGAAGLLRGRRATTHWLFHDDLRDLGAEPTHERVVEAGEVVTAAGVSAGLDMALWLVAVEAGDDVARAIQLSIEYAPQPPFESGSPATAPQHVVDLVRAVATAEEI